MDLFDIILRYAVVPVSGFVWTLHLKVQAHATEIAVMRSQIDAGKDAHDRELRDMKKTIDAIFAKLDSIEAALRK
jgi:hypothetical protein